MNRRAIGCVFGTVVVVIWPALIRSVRADEPRSPQAAVGAAPAELAVNAESETYDSKPSLAVLPDGSAWVAWHAYGSGRDRVLARRLGPAAAGPAQTVSAGGRVHDAPIVVAVGKDAAWVFWAARADRRWRLLGRKVDAEQWRPVVTLSDDDGDALNPAAVAIDEDRLTLAWSVHRGGRSRIRARLLREGTWSEPFDVSGAAGDSFRSTLAVDTERRVWIAWDAYADGHYAVWARPLEPQLRPGDRPNLGPVERLSPQQQNCLQPTALTANHRLCVAWLQAGDVIGGQGAISQWYTLHAALRDDDRWRPIRDADRSSTAATLTHGLVARMEPEPVATGGYLGRRRHPMLLADGDAVWLLWERKSDHRGTTPNSTGELIGRRAVDGRWQEPVVLHSGRLDYRVAHAASASGGTFVLLASDLPRDWRRVYYRMVGDLNASAPFDQGAWTGWRPVRLPLGGEDGPRHEIRDGGKTYRLYWGDLHCHSGLTADAEGEPDELLHYARDRARLDVVVMTENDALYNCYLTEGEFALGHFFATRFTREGEFLVLPGFEWTSRLPRSADVDRSDPRNWDSRRSAGSYPNHRTVIYPPEGGPVVRHPEVQNDIANLYDAVAAAGGVTCTQHETWDLVGHPVEVGVEVTSGWRLYIRDPGRLHGALDAGHRVGLVANGDSHRRCPGLAGALTGIYAERLTPEAILDALRNRRVYATNGSRIVLDSRANGWLMGREVFAADGNVEIVLSVVGTRPVVRATLIRDGQEVKTFEGNGSRRLSAVYEDADLPAGTHWYYWRVTQEGASPAYPGNVEVARGPLAWSTPHWVNVGSPPR